MGFLNFVQLANFGPWKTTAALTVSAAVFVPAWHGLVASTNTATVPASFPLIDRTNSDTVIVYAAPVNADPVLRISKRDADGNWLESEMQLNHEHPDQSAKIVKAVVTRETATHRTQP